MHIVGSGTRDSPFAIDDDSEDENITLPSYRDDSCTPPDDPLLSSRPGTFLSTISRPRFPMLSVQGVNQPTEGLQQSQRNRKRKRTATPHNTPSSPVLVKPLKKESVPPPVMGQKSGEPQRESRKQKKLRLKLERERAAAQEVRAKAKGKGKQKAIVVDSPSVPSSQRPQVTSSHMVSQDENAPPAKRPKHNAKPPISTTERVYVTPGPISGPSSSTKPPPPSNSASQSVHAQYQSKPQVSDMTSGPSSTVAYNSPYPAPQYIGDPISSLPPRPSGFDSFVDPSLMAQGMQPPYYGMEFDPLLSWLYMPIGAFSTPMSMSSMSMPPMPMSNAPMDQPQLHTTSGPPKPPSNTRQKASKASKKSQPVQNPEKPFNIRILNRGDEASSQVYIPIGKPDFQFKHGVFPIIPSIMLPSTFSIAASSSTPNVPTSDQNPYAPNLLSTLVLENVSKSSSKLSWIEDWCVAASGVLPKLVLLAPTRALVEFWEPEDAIAAWASRRVGLDEFGPRSGASGASGTGNGRGQCIFAYWYRPDLEQEKGLLELWKHSKRLLTDFVGVATVKDEGAVTRAIVQALDRTRAKLQPKLMEEGESEEGGGNEDEVMEVMGLDVSFFPDYGFSQDTKGEFRKLAGLLAFKEKLENALQNGLEADHLLVWEQREIAKIDRARSFVNAREKEKRRRRRSINASIRKRKSEGEAEEGEVKEDENDLRRKRVRPGNEAVVPNQTRVTAPAAVVPTQKHAPPSKPPPHTSTSTSTLLPPKLNTAKPQATTSAGKFTVIKPSTISTTSLPLKPHSPSPLSSGSGKPAPFSNKSNPANPQARPIASSSATAPNPKAPATTATQTPELSSIIKPRGLGLLLTMPSIASGSQKTGTLTSVANILPTPSPSAPVLQAQARNKSSQKLAPGSTSSSTLTSSVVAATPVLRPSALFDAIRTQEDVEMKPPSIAANGAVSTSSSKPMVFRPSTLLASLEEKERAIGLAGEGRPKVADSAPIESGHIANEMMVVDDVDGGVSGADESRRISVSQPDAAVAGSRWATGQENLTKDLRTIRQALLSQTSASPASQTPDVSSITKRSSSNSEPRTKVNPPLLLSEPVTPREVLRDDEKKSSLSGAAPVFAMDDMDVSPVVESSVDIKLPPPVVNSDTPSSQQTGTRQVQMSTTVTISTTRSVSVPVSAPPARIAAISPQTLAELVKVLAKPQEERQKFLDSELKATRTLMDQLVAMTCKKERKRITGLWKEKLRVIDEVTKSIKHDARVWYSQETKTWVRMRWPETSEGAGVLIISDDED
ncbi:hypothetical protein AN958_08159 [Leucoagaricus sp. SymC.cos]|nr:hypothetical protein AN958_08159 [Leucoagaricus sp. SymC.cos]